MGSLIAVLILTACSHGDTAQHRPPGDGTSPIVLVKRQTALSPAGARWALPDFVLLGDGTAIVAADSQGIVLSARKRRLSDAQIAELFQRGDDAGLFDSRTYRRETVDGSTLVVTITSATGRYVTEVEQPVRGEGGDRGRVAAFARTAPTLGEPAGDYEPRRAAVLVVASNDDTTDVRPWPLPTPLSAMPGAPARPCLVVDGDRIPPLLALAGGATSRTRWATDGQRLALLVRPLLPYENACADLDRN
jgi:hypothetical protein